MKNSLIILLTFLAFHANAQIVINEGSSDIESVFIDEFGNSSDWIELYNPGTIPFNLDDYFLCDNETKPSKWAFPNIEIAPDGYLIIFALQLGPEADSIYPFWGANYWRDVTLPISMEYFDENKERQVQFDLGTEMHGGRESRVNPQKAFRLLAGHEFGNSIIDYPFFAAEIKTLNNF